MPRLFSHSTLAQEESTPTINREALAAPKLGRELVIADNKATARQNARAMMVESTDITVESIERFESYTNSTVSRKRTLRPLLVMKTRRKKIAATTLTLSLLFGLRWWQGGQLPAIPADNFKPVYQVSGPNANENYIQSLTQLSNEQAEQASSACCQVEDALFPDQIKLSETQLTDLVQTNQKALDYLHQAAMLPYYANYYPTYAGTYYRIAPQYPVHAGLEKPVPNFVKVRGIARLAVVEAYLQAKKGEYGKATSTGMDTIKFGNDLQQGTHNSLIEYLVGSLVKNIGIKTVHQQIAHLTADEAREQIRRLEEIRQQKISLASALKSEETMAREFMRTVSQQQDQYTWKTLDGTTHNPQEVLQQAAIMSWARLHYGWTGMYQNYQNNLDTMVKNTSLPYAQGSKLPEITPAKDDIFSNSMVPNYQRAYLTATLQEANQRITLAYLGIQAYKQEQGGAFPASLETLVKGGYLKEIPINPFSPNGDSPLAYNPQTGEVTAQMPEIPKGYELLKPPHR